ncbi:MAG TPA: aminodeoxychorismate/anthranilate synthase component II [Candidatus Anammoximicrobium sp.]|mgnify:CR=1 FL=1|nr:aminodeoxychorismate/anthranilate synthase component II [Candidatus Anammoximicrobium sp.]
MILLIDNYDSFVHNLARYFRRLGQETVVVRNDAIGLDDIPQLQPRAIVLSPGPCTPHEAGCSLELVRRFHATIPLLGVCLGHQTLAAALGGRIVRAPEPMHGRISQVLHDGRDLFDGLPNPFPACRYHSLVVDEASLPPCLAVTARTASGVVMALRHRELPLIGLQFHPESILTPSGYVLLARFLLRCGETVPEVLPGIDNEWQQEPCHDSRSTRDDHQRRRHAPDLADGAAG